VDEREGVEQFQRRRGVDHLGTVLATAGPPPPVAEGRPDPLATGQDEAAQRVQRTPRGAVRPRRVLAVDERGERGVEALPQLAGGRPGLVPGHLERHAGSPAS
jgi:hypothetical protein